MSNTLIPTVAILATKKIDGKLRLLLQRRQNPKEDSLFRGMWELPKGKIRGGETVLDAARRELLQETQLKIDSLLPTNSIDAFFSPTAMPTEVSVFEPYVCVQSRNSHSYLMIVLLAKASGQTRDTIEASNHTWYDIERLIVLLQKEKILPIDHPVIHKWVIDSIMQNGESEVQKGMKLLAKSNLRFRKGVVGHPTICFDVGGVLIRQDKKKATSLLAKFFDRPTEYFDHNVMSNGLVDAFIMGEMTPKAFWSRLCRITEKKRSYRSFLKLWIQLIEPIKPNVKIFEQLRYKYPLFQFVALTNLDMIKHCELVEKHDWYCHFDYRHVSCRLKISKPNVQIFESLLPVIQCNPESVFFIDDKQENIWAAKSLGFSVFTAQRNKPLTSSLFSSIEKWHRRLGI